jgi:hypothetical protein
MDAKNERRNEVMREAFVWKATVTFKGTAEQFNKMIHTLEDFPVEAEIPEWEGINPHIAGCERFPYRMLVSDDLLNSIVADMPRYEVVFLQQDIAGGIRTPHLHLGNEVVFLDRTRFKTFVGHVAQGLAERRVEAGGDYIQVMRPVGDLASIAPVPQPVP